MGGYPGDEYTHGEEMGQLRGKRKERDRIVALVDVSIAEVEKEAVFEDESIKKYKSVGDTEAMNQSSGMATGLRSVVKRLIGLKNSIKGGKKDAINT